MRKGLREFSNRRAIGLTSRNRASPQGRPGRKATETASNNLDLYPIQLACYDAWR